MCWPYPSGSGWVSRTRWSAASRLTSRTCLSKSSAPSNPSTVSATTWTDGPWPFTIEGGELTCIGLGVNPGVFLVTARGEMFALNPAAILMADRVGANSGPGPDLAERSRHRRCEGECVADDPACVDPLLRRRHGSRNGRHRSVAA